MSGGMLLRNGHRFISKSSYDFNNGIYEIDKTITIIIYHRMERDQWEEIWLIFFWNFGVFFFFYEIYPFALACCLFLHNLTCIHIFSFIFCLSTILYIIANGSSYRPNCCYEKKFI